MKWTPEQVSNLSEDALRKEVLIPLFQAMGYRDVQHYHGGPLEIGKDIVMWEPDTFGNRTYYAVVVKKGDLNGSVAVVGEVGTQVRQCFDSPFKDSLTCEDRDVQKALVVASGRIPKEFTNAIQGYLDKTNYRQYTNFIDGQKLWELIEKYLPEKTLLDKIHDLQRFVTEQMPGHTAEITVGVKTTVVGVSTAASVGSVEATGKITIPAEGEAREKYQSFLKTGEPFELTKEQLAGVEMPPFLTKTVGFSLDKIDSLRFEPTPSKPKTYSFHRVSDDGDVATLPNVELIATKAGTDRVTLTNEHQPVPWTFHLVLEPTGKVSFSYAVRLPGHNVKEVLDWLHFQRVLSKPGRLFLRELNTAIEYPLQPDVGCGTPPGNSHVKLAERLFFIQTKARLPISYPKKLADEDQQAIDQLFTILKRGKLPLNTVAFSINKGALRKSGQTFSSPAPLNLDVSENQERVCLGLTFAVGPAHIICSSAALSQDTARSFAADLAAGADEDSIRLTFVPSGNDPMELVYPHWLTDSP